MTLRVRVLHVSISHMKFRIHLNSNGQACRVFPAVAVQETLFLAQFGLALCAYAAAITVSPFKLHLSIIRRQPTMYTLIQPWGRWCVGVLSAALLSNLSTGDSSTERSNTNFHPPAHCILKTATIES